MMSASKPTSCDLLLLIFIFIFIFCFPNSCLSSLSNVPCFQMEKNALLTFKKSITRDPQNLLSSWHSTNCCNWEGVHCNNTTGHVERLDLHGGSLEGHVSRSLLNLSQLKYLDLSFNNFQETTPSFIGSLASLEYLNLEDAGFHGMIPHSFGNLSNIKNLHFGIYANGFGNSLDWLSGLSLLQQLIITGVNFSRVANWVQVISALPSLVELRLPFCSLDYMAPVNDVNTTFLKILDLSVTFSQSPIPRWIVQQSNLVFLDLSGAGFYGSIPAIVNFTKIQYLDLSGNFDKKSSIPDWLYSCTDLEFVSLQNCSLENTISDAVENLTSLAHLHLARNELAGKIPRGVTKLCKMQELILFGNKLEGDISQFLGNMSHCFIGALRMLHLSNNQLSGHLTHHLGEFKNIHFLALSRNKISGEIPENLGKLTYLVTLKLQENNLTGNLPISMGQLSKLEQLDVSNNMLDGVVTEIHFSNLTKLKGFLASQNHLTLKVNQNWVPPFYLIDLLLGSWNLDEGLPIPSWLRTQKNTLVSLDLSNTGISGNVPTWFWKLQYLNLSHNHLYGKVPDINGSEMVLSFMYLNSNQFSGSLPRMGYSLIEINLSNNSFSGGIGHFLCDTRHGSASLFNLHLGQNHLTGEIPDCWTKWPSLRVLNLGNNNFSGAIPNSIGFLTNMLSLNLNGNKLSGQIPISITNCTKIIKMDLSSNYITGSIPKWIGARLTKLRFLILRSNQFSNVIPLTICQLKSLQILDISDNVISGIIPTCLNNFTAMIAKRNLSIYVRGDLDFSFISGSFLETVIVATKGNEYEFGTILSLVTNIDLSNNKLWGEFPKELTSLVELKSLNLSGNQLSGSIPKSIGNMTQLESLDLSRNSLHGEIPDSFTAMSYLGYLNLSYNHLTGKIPISTQLIVMDASSFIGNDLCGLPLPTKCTQGDDAHGLHKEDNKGEIDWFYVYLSLGYATGLSIFCTTLILKKSWRIACFRLTECIWDKLYAYFLTKWMELRRPRVVPQG